MVTGLIQSVAAFTVEPGNQSPSAVGSNKSQDSFATALQSAVNSNTPLKTSAQAKAGTPAKPSEEEKAAPVPQQMFAPVALPTIPPAQDERSGTPFSALPGKVGERSVAQPEGNQSPATGSGTQPPPLPLSFPGRDLGTAGDAPSGTAGSGVPLLPASLDGVAENVTNPLDAMMEPTAIAALAPPVDVAAASGNGPQSPVSTVSNLTAPIMPLALTAPVVDASPDGATLVGSALTATAAKVASDSQSHSTVSAAVPGSAPASPSEFGMVVAAAGPQAGARGPLASKAPRVMDTEARKVGSLPLREATVMTPASSEIAKTSELPAPFRTGATTITASAVDSANTAVKGKATAESADTTSLPATSAADGPLPLPVEAQPASSQTVAVTVIPVSTGQQSGSPVPAARSTDALPHPVAGSGDAEPGSSGLVQSARVVEGAAQAEMHIGFRSPAFGNVEVHTAVRDTQLGLAVSSERGDLRGFLAPEVSGLQTVFHQQGLQFDQIRFMAHASGAGTGFSSGGDSHADSSGNGRGSRSWFSADAAPEPEVATSEIQASATRLSVHA